MFREGPVKWWILRHSTLHTRGGGGPDIFVFSTARSGSTWLMELIASQPRIRFIDEPLLLERFASSRFAPLPSSWETLLPHPQREPLLRDYFEKLLDNRLAIGAPRPFSRFHRFVTDRTVLKLLRVKDMMNWFERQFGAQIVYLIRHPLATSVSRARFERLPLFLQNEEFRERFLPPRLHELAMKISASGSDLEKKVLDWCLQNLPPLCHLDRTRWTCVAYEDLVASPRQTLARVAEALSLKEPEKLMRGLGKPSSSTHHSSRETRRYLQQASGEEDRSRLLRAWRKRVSAEEERAAFDIVEHFGIDVYRAGEDMPVREL